MVKNKKFLKLILKIFEKEKLTYTEEKQQRQSRTPFIIEAMTLIVPESADKVPESMERMEIKFMTQPIMRDIAFLKQKSLPATQADRQVALDLLDTLKAHESECVGMAANMIGVRKNIIAVNMGFMNVAMFNPVIVKKSGAFETEEGCLSLIGVRKINRYEEIEVEYEDMNFKKQHQKFSGWTAQIIQHECDHLEGIII